MGSSLAVVDTAAYSIRAIAPGIGGPIANVNHGAVHPDAGRVCVASTIPYTLQIMVLGASTLSVLGNIGGAAFDGFCGYLGISLSPDGGRIFPACRDVTSGKPNRLFIVDAGTGSVLASVAFQRDSTHFYGIHALSAV